MSALDYALTSLQLKYWKYFKAGFVFLWPFSKSLIALKSAGKNQLIKTVWNLHGSNHLWKILHKYHRYFRSFFHFPLAKFYHLICFQSFLIRSNYLN